MSTPSRRPIGLAMKDRGLIRLGSRARGWPVGAAPLRALAVDVFYHPVREFYDLEGLWIQAPRGTIGHPAPRFPGHVNPEILRHPLASGPLKSQRHRSAGRQAGRPARRRGLRRLPRPRTPAPPRRDHRRRRRRGARAALAEGRGDDRARAGRRQLDDRGAGPPGRTANDPRHAQPDLRGRRRRRIRRRWSPGPPPAVLSALTLPHRIARLILSEQIYRALTIIRGEPYHH